MNPFADLFAQTEADHQLPPGLLTEVARQESNYNPTAVGPKTKYGTAKGLFQFIDPTAKEYGITDPFDPIQSTKAAGEYLGTLYKKYDGDLTKTLAAYNWGPGHVDRIGIEKAPAETRNYVQRIASRLGNAVISSAQADPVQDSAASSFDVQGALKEGYTPAEIADHLSQTRKFDLAGARNEGYSDDEIIQHLTGSQPDQATTSDAPSQHAYQVPGTTAYQAAAEQNKANAAMDVNPAAGETGPQQFMEGAGKAFTDIALGATQRLTNNPADAEGLRKQAIEKARLDAPLAATGYGKAGEITGQIASVAPAMAIPGANTLIGGALLGGLQGGLQPTTEEGQATNNALLGTALGGIGSGIGKAIGAIVRPTRGLSPSAAAAAQPVINQGGRLLPGQATGNRFFQGLEASLEAFPPTAGSIGRVKGGNQQVLNSMAASAIGENAQAITPDVLQAADQRISDVFRSVATNKPLKVDSTIVKSGLDAIEQDMKGVADIAQHPLFNEADDVVKTGMASGRQLQHLSSRLRTAASQQMSSPTGNRELGKGLFRVRELIDDQLQAGLPKEQGQALATAREQYRNLMLITGNKNVLNEATGDVSARTLAGALKSKDKSSYLYGRNAPRASTQNLHDVARFGKHFDSLIGNSGTSTRQFLPWLLGSGGLGAAASGMSSGDPLTGGAVGLGLPIAAALLGRGYASPVVTNYLINGIRGMQIQNPLVQNLLRGTATALPTAAIEGQ